MSDDMNALKSIDQENRSRKIKYISNILERINKLDDFSDELIEQILVLFVKKSELLRLSNQLKDILYFFRLINDDVVNNLDISVLSKEDHYVKPQIEDEEFYDNSTGMKLKRQHIKVKVSGEIFEVMTLIFNESLEVEIDQTGKTAQGQKDVVSDFQPFKELMGHMLGIIQLDGTTVPTSLRFLKKENAYQPSIYRSWNS